MAITGGLSGRIGAADPDVEAVRPAKARPLSEGRGQAWSSAGMSSNTGCRAASATKASTGECVVA